MQNNKKLLVVLVVLVSFSLACGTLTIYNNDNVFPVRVVVVLPDGNGSDSIVLKAGGKATYYSDTDGSYSVTAILDEDAVNEMRKLRSSLRELLFDPGYEELTGDLISDAVDKLFVISYTIQSQYQVSCSGMLKEDEEATVSIEFDVTDQKIEISCH